MPLGRVFGGQVFAQSLIAAQRTVAAGRVVHSMHAYFLRPGRVDLPITFAVDRIHDGRSFSTRRAQAYQDGLPILSAILSFQDEDGGLEHQVTMPADVPDPDTVPSGAESIGDDDRGLARFWATGLPFDIRHIPSPVYLTVEGERVAAQAAWVKSTGALPDDPDLHRAALAYATDYTIFEPVLRRHGVPWMTPGLKSASLDHAVWWHRAGRVDEWVLHVLESPSARGGRGLSFGRIFARDGSLLASVAQEGMIRVPTP
ncbi:acyl-CoA thioesterase II (plasmid) [Herbiconiux sp. SALV-R1]|nr:acyl-CoA thioesterase II [Herbiconiux sp. SALV-R1]